MEKTSLEGYTPTLVTDDQFLDAIEKAFDYRGDITLTTRQGQTIEGYLFDRRVLPNGDGELRLFTKEGTTPTVVKYNDMTSLKFSGKDTAAGKSFETWVKKYNEKKAAGEKNIGIASEPLE